jgi:hypothetical protein
MKSMFRSVDRAQCERSPSNGEGLGEVTRSCGWRMEVLGNSGNQFRAIIRRIGNPRSASKLSPNRMEVIELIGVPGGIRTLVCAVKEPG